MRVKIKVCDILAETDLATLFLLKGEQECWIPKSRYCWGRGNFIIVPQRLADEKGLQYSTYIHIPDEINPEPDQEPLDELLY